MTDKMLTKKERQQIANKIIDCIEKEREKQEITLGDVLAILRDTTTHYVEIMAEQDND